MSTNRGDGLDQKPGFPSTLAASMARTNKSQYAGNNGPQRRFEMSEVTRWPHRPQPSSNGKGFAVSAAD
jgi:hypothetical protein